MSLLLETYGLEMAPCSLQPGHPLLVFDLGDPLNPQLTDTIITPGLASGVEIHPDGSLFVADMDNGVVWYTEQK